MAQDVLLAPPSHYLSLSCTAGWIDDSWGALKGLVVGFLHHKTLNKDH